MIRTFGFLLAVSLFGQDGARKPPPEPTADFGIRLLGELAAKSPEGNVCISPVSIMLALRMAHEGAAGETRAEMEKALGIQGLTAEELRKRTKALVEGLAGADPKVTTTVANSVWIHRPLRADYVELCRKEFAAEATTLDFGKPDAAGTINGWVKKKTQGRIEAIVPDPVPVDVAAYLINAVYFKAPWKTPFDPKRTHQRRFRVSEKMAVQVPMMYRDGPIQSMGGRGFQAVRLPYGTGERLAMYLFVPDEASTLDGFLKGLTADAWAGWMSSFKPGPLDFIGIPRLKMECGFGLVTPLKALGMRQAFSDAAADFSRMSAEALFISDVKHKTFIEVNEEGTEAAAATSVEMKPTSEPPHLVADRPFLFAIRDDKEGAVLFLGVVRDPSR